MKIKEIFSANLKRLRGNRTQAEMAELADIPLRSYQRAEYGDIPQDHNLEAICAALGKPVSELFKDPNPPEKLSLEDSLAALQEAVEELKRFRAMPPPVQMANPEHGPLFARIARVVGNPTKRRRLEAVLRGLESPRELTAADVSAEVRAQLLKGEKGKEKA